MVIKILLIISIILQLGAATVAIGMIRKTKYNLSWMLFTVALTGLAGLRFGEYVQITHMKELHVPQEFFVWLGIIVSLCFAVGILIVNKLLNYIARTESQRRISERRILNTVLRTEEKERRRFFERFARWIGTVAFFCQDVCFSLVDFGYECTESRDSSQCDLCCG